MADEPFVVSRASRSITVLAAVAAAALALWVVGSIIEVLCLCFAGTLLGLFLHGVGIRVHRWTGVPRGVAVGAFCLILLGGAAIVVWLASPAVAAQIDQLTDAVPRALQTVTDPLQRFSWGRRLLERVRHPGEMIGGGETWSRAGGVISTMLGGIGSLLVIAFVGLFVAFDPRPYVRGILCLVPPSRRARAGEILAQLSRTLQMWMFGKLVAMAVVGVATGLGLALLGIPLALVLALLAAALTFIPNFGPVISAIPALLLAMGQGSMQVLWVAGLYLAIQTCESYVLTPLMQKRMTALPPALTLVAQVVMGALAGGLGLVVATPMTAAALVIVKEGYVRDVLGDAPRPEPASDP